MNVLTAYHKVLEHAVAGKALCRQGITNFVEAVELDPSLAKKALGDLEFAKYVKDATFCNILK